MFKKCLENRIIRHEGDYKCCLCHCEIKQKFDLVLEHLRTDEHKERLNQVNEKQQNDEFDLLAEMSESQLRKIAENWITFDRCFASSFYCHVCKCSVGELGKASVHIGESSHVLALNKFVAQHEPEANKTSCDNNNKTRVSKNNSQASKFESQLKSESVTCSEKTNSIDCNSCKTNIISDPNTTKNALQNINIKSCNEAVLKKKSLESCFSEIYCCNMCQAPLRDNADVQCHVTLHLFKEFKLLNNFDVLELKFGAEEKTYLKCLLCDFYCLSNMSDAHEFLREHFKTETHVDRLKFFKIDKNELGLEAVDEQIDSIDLKKFSYNVADDICPSMLCNICDISVPCSKIDLDQHTSGKYHEKRLKDLENDAVTDNKARFDAKNDHYYKCFVCNTSFCNASILFDHYKTPEHKWKIDALKMIKQCSYTKFKRLNEMQILSCSLCNIFFNDFQSTVEHLLGKEHNEQINLILLFEKSIKNAKIDQLTEKINSNVNQKDEVFMVSNLTVATSEFLDNIDENVNLLVSESDQVDLEVEKETALLTAIMETVKTTYPNAEAYIFGSRLSRLGFLDSDVDIFLDCENVYYKSSSNEQNQRYIKTVKKNFKRTSDIWNIQEVLLHARVPIMRLRHVPTNLHCDISFVNGLSVEKSRLVGIYISAFPICRKLILFMKKWLILCRIFGSDYLTTIAISWCVIFYLQIQGILPSVHELIKIKIDSKIVDGWECGFEAISTEKYSELSFKDHLKGFFTYFANFDYRKRVVCPYLGQAINKRAFAYTDELPPEMDIYKIRLKGNEIGMFRFNCPMCIQDPVDLSQNITKAIKQRQLRCFSQYCSLSAEKC